MVEERKTVSERVDLRRLNGAVFLAILATILAGFGAAVFKDGTRIFSVCNLTLLCIFYIFMWRYTMNSWKIDMNQAWAINERARENIADQTAEIDRLRGALTEERSKVKVLCQKLTTQGDELLALQMEQDVARGHQSSQSNLTAQTIQMSERQAAV